MARYVYTQPASVLVIDGKEYRFGDEVELTDEQAQRHRFRIRPVEEPKPEKKAKK